MPGMAINAQPFVIQLKNPFHYPHKRQYSSKPEARHGLQILITKFVKFGLLGSCHSLCNSPVLPILNPNQEYRAVQV
jgi:hypothetical protein